MLVAGDVGDMDVGDMKVCVNVLLRIMVGGCFVVLAALLVQPKSHASFP